MQEIKEGAPQPPTEIAEKNIQSPVARLFHTAGELCGWVVNHLAPRGDYYWRSVHNTGQGRYKRNLS
jgi:hypothetical protein